MGYQQKLAFLGLPVTFVAVYILQSWTSYEIYSFNPVKSLKLTEAAQSYRKYTSSVYTTRGPTVNEYVTNEGTAENLSQDVDPVFAEPRASVQGSENIFKSTSKSNPETQNENFIYSGRHPPTKIFANTTGPLSRSDTNYSLADKIVEYAFPQSSECDKPPRGAAFDELLRRYRHCMGKLVSLALEDGNGKVSPAPLDEQTPYQDFGLLMGDGWREMAGRLASVKKGCRVPAVEFTGAPTLADVIFDKAHHLAYLRHGKAATTSLMSFLLWLNGVDATPLSTDELHKSIFTYLPRPTHESQKDLLERSFSFTAVRHPFRRLVSAYCDKEVGNNLEILPYEIQIMSPEEREKELLEYSYKEKSGTREPTQMAGTRVPTQMAGPFIRRAIADGYLSEGDQKDGSLLAHYLSAVDLNSTQREDYINPTTGNQGIQSEGGENQGVHSEGGENLGVHSEGGENQGVHSEGGENHTTPNLSSAEPFRMFVHGVVLELLNCRSDTSCLGLTDRHINPQVIRWNPCVLNFDMVMKVETLYQDIELLKDLLGLHGPLAEEEEGPFRKIGDIHDERMEEDLNPGQFQRKLRSRRAETQNDDAESEKEAVKKTQTYTEDDGFMTIENQAVNGNIVGNTDKTIESGEHHELSVKRIDKTTPGAQSEVNSGTGFFKRNTSGRKCGTYEDNMKQLSQRDIDLIYTCYYWDFKLFGYKPFD